MAVTRVPKGQPVVGIYIMPLPGRDSRNRERNFPMEKKIYVRLYIRPSFVPIFRLRAVF